MAVEKKDSGAVQTEGEVKEANVASGAEEKKDSDAIQTEGEATKTDAASGAASGNTSGPTSETRDTSEQTGGGELIQFGGVVGRDTIDPTDPYDIGYVAGYKEAYTLAYARAYSLTKAIHTSGKLLIPTSGEGNFEAVVSKLVSGPRTTPDSMPQTENNSGPSGQESGAQESGAQEGGSLRRAKRVYKRGKTLTQHAHLLKRIANRTIAV